MRKAVIAGALLRFLFFLVGTGVLQSASPLGGGWGEIFPNPVGLGSHPSPRGMRPSVAETDVCVQGVLPEILTGLSQSP